MTKQKKRTIYKPEQVWLSPIMFNKKNNKYNIHKKKATNEDIQKIMKKHHIKPSFEEPEIDNIEDMDDILNKMYKESIKTLRKSLS